MKDFNVNLKPSALALLSCIIILQVPPSFAGQQCSQLFTNSKEDLLAGPKFLHRLYPKLFRTPKIEHRTHQINLNSAKKMTQPEAKIGAWLDYLEKTHNEQRSSPEEIHRIKEFYFRENVIKFEDIPKEYYDLQVRLARQDGHGTLTLNEKSKQELAAVVINDQRKSLEVWLDYFFSIDSDSYPMWAKYWCFTNLKKLSNFDPSTNTFKNRSKGQVAPYPELNREALAIVMDGIVKLAHQKSLEDIKDPAFIELLKTANFGNLYGRALSNLSSQKMNLRITAGQWVKYNQGSNPRELVDSLQGKNTGWCTAGESTAQSQLSKGDFYVYYSQDEIGRSVNPRIAIRMVGETIGEVRGIDRHQSMDSEIIKTSILKDKLVEFGSQAEQYNKKTEHMKRLTEIEVKHREGISLTNEELRFLYEVNENIVGFGQQKDPRIEEIIATRNIKADLVSAFDGKYSKQNFSVTREEALRGGIKFHYGNLYFPLEKTLVDIELPEMMSGNLYFGQLKSAKGLKLPIFVGGYLSLKSLTSSKGLVLPEWLGGNILLLSPKILENLTLPKRFLGEIYVGHKLWQANAAE